MGLTGHGTIVDVVVIIAVLIIVIVIIRWLIAPLLFIYGGGDLFHVSESLKPIITQINPQLQLSSS